MKLENKAVDTGFAGRFRCCSIYYLIYTTCVSLPETVGFAVSLRLVLMYIKSQAHRSCFLKWYVLLEIHNPLVSESWLVLLPQPHSIIFSIHSSGCVIVQTLH